jgi:Ala-tRNA(Pro) deacylase
MDIKDYLVGAGIEFQLYTHSAVFTCEEAENCKEYKSIKGIHSKNLFLKDRKARRFYLIIMPIDKKLDLSEIEKISGDKIKFGNEDELKSILGLSKGSVSPFGLINDSEHKTIVYIDKIVWESEYVSFHPNINTQTIGLTGENFQKYIKKVGNIYKVV